MEINRAEWNKLNLKQQKEVMQYLRFLLVIQFLHENYCLGRMIRYMIYNYRRGNSMKLI